MYNPCFEHINLYVVNMGSGASSTKPPSTTPSRPRGRTEALFNQEGRRPQTLLILEPPQPPSSDGQLKVKSVDLKIYSNSVEHNTNDYDVPYLIVRRGQSFDIDVTFEREFNPESDKLGVVLRVGEPPHRVSKGTLLMLPFMDGELSDSNSGVKILSTRGDKVSLSVYLLSKAHIGKYTLAIETISTSNSEEFFDRFTVSQPMYVLFNPWCKDDDVYMEGVMEREEYVLNDFGFIWYGTYRQLGKRRWNFGQFESEVFEAVMYLLELGVVPWARNNAVLVARVLSSLGNSQDDDGVLVGNWSGDYAGGTKPTSWTGSVAIFEEYNRTKKPVSFGQCWVFSGILTTMLRCLGIPARSVTNYASSHDTDGSLTIDRHYDDTGMVLESLNGDSVWNFHVWNDCWMARPDLPPGYGGWQALDATPQERSEGVYWTGPAPLAAVKQGHVYYGYDTGFVFAEVNADRIDWECTTFKGFVTKMKARNVQKSAVGKFISTKAVMGNDREDITHLYKFSEDSEENRMAVACAIEHGSRPNTYDTDDGPDDVQFEIETDDMVTVGDDYDVRIKVVNKSNEKRTVDVYIASHVCHYTGIPVKNSKCKDQHIDLVLEPNSSSEAVKRVVCSDYLGKLADQSAMKIYAMGKVRETKQMWADQDDFRLRTPDLTLETEGPLQVGKEFTLKIYLKNPIPSTLSQCTVSVEGPGLQKPKKVRHNNIIPHGDMKMEVKLTPRKAGNRVIMASFDSKQLDNITGSLDLKIAPRA